MRTVDRARWLARVDMEDIVGVILRNGMLVSAGSIVAGLLLLWTGHGQAPDPWLRASSLLTLLRSDLQHLGDGSLWPTRLVHVGILALMITPYLRVAATVWYFAMVERSAKHAVFTGLVLIILTITLLTTLV